MSYMMDNVSEMLHVERTGKIGGNINWNNGGQIRQFYAGKRILLTGSTGFLGTGIVEKLLRTCLEIDKIYLIIRTRGKMTVEERMENYFRSPVFDVLQKENPNFKSKIHIMQGDLQNANLGLSPEDYKLLTENVNVIIHNAADISFFARLSSILKTNSLGTKYMLDLAEKCTNLYAFVYVSSVYSQAHNDRIEEKCYTPPGDIRMVEDLIKADEAIPNGFNKHTLRKILGKWVNTYTFSKAITEGFVAEFARRSTIPCAIYRPTLIMSSAKEPTPGLITHKTGVSGLTLVYSLGIMHCLPIRSDTIIDFVPIDMTVNSLLACIWDLSTRKKSDGPQVYNYGSSHWKPFFNKVYHMLSIKRLEEYPLSNMYWYPFMIYTRHYYLFVILSVIFNIIPAAVYDFGCWIAGKKGRGLELTLKIAEFNSSLHYFLCNTWIVEVGNTQNILIHMNKADYEEFPFDLGKIEWDKFMYDFCLGMKTHLMKESKDSIPAARERFRKFMIIHYAMCTCFVIFIMVFVFKIISIAFY
nr:PREDICTED: putative fatty acyl-CoA reductase CG8306 isoform X3 [Megachile rotundata]